jgi:hypothetical protein
MEMSQGTINIWCLNGYVRLCTVAGDLSYSQQVLLHLCSGNEPKVSKDHTHCLKKAVLYQIYLLGMEVCGVRDCGDKHSYSRSGARRKDFEVGLR